MEVSAAPPDPSPQYVPIVSSIIRVMKDALRATLKRIPSESVILEKYSKVSPNSSALQQLLLFPIEYHLSCHMVKHRIVAAGLRDAGRDSERGAGEGRSPLSPLSDAPPPPPIDAFALAAAPCFSGDPRHDRPGGHPKGPQAQGLPPPLRCSWRCLVTPLCTRRRQAYTLKPPALFKAHKPVISALIVAVLRPCHVLQVGGEA